MTTGTILKTIWQNRRHFKLQIFGVVVLLVVTVFVANLISIKVSYDNRVETYVESTVQYTSDFQMSLSGVKGSVNNIYVDSTKTKCFILAKLNNTSILTMTANKYQVMIADVTRDGVYDKKPNEQLTGEIYMFGASGLVGIYVKSDIPFANRMKQLTLRSYSKFTSNTQPYFRMVASDAAYDQCHMFFNPGASGAETIGFLEDHTDGEDFDPSVINRQVYTVDKETEIREDIEQFYRDLSGVMNQIVEYRKRLGSSYNLQVPDLPDTMKGDGFNDVPVYDDEGNEISSYKRFVPATILSGGTDYDWYNGSILTGYYCLVPNTDNMTIRDYIYKLNSDAAVGSSTTIKYEKWYYTDGTEVMFVADKTSTSYEREMKSTIDKYVDLLKEYVKLKKTYQTDYLPSLLLLEADSATIGQAYTVRNDENAIVTY